MNKQSATRHVALVAKSLSRICNAEVNAYGMIFTDDIGDNPENEYLWVDGWDFTAWIIFDKPITDSEILKCQKFLSREVYTKQADLSGSNATKIYFGEGIRYFVPQSTTTTQHTLDASITGRLETKITIPEKIINSDELRF